MGEMVRQRRHKHMRNWSSKPRGQTRKRRSSFPSHLIGREGSVLYICDGANIPLQIPEKEASFLGTHLPHADAWNTAKSIDQG